jgi:putative transposase
MAHAKNKVWIHGIFTPKYRAPVLIKQLRPTVYEQIRIQLTKIDCHLEEIGGIEDHVHVLFLLNRSITISYAFKQMKGASSRLFNLQKLFEHHFLWQQGYAAYSVSESVVPKVMRYIQNQEQHHATQSFLSEYEEFLKYHNLPYNDVTFE